MCFFILKIMQIKARWKVLPSWGQLKECETGLLAMLTALHDSLVYLQKNEKLFAPTTKKKKKKENDL